MKKKIAMVTNAYPDSGVGSRAYEIATRISGDNTFDTQLVMLDGKTATLQINTSTHKKITKLPGILGAKSITWVRLAKKLPFYDGYDFTNQSLSFIAKHHQPAIITVHDIIEKTNPQSRSASLVNRYLLSGIPYAKHIIAVSEYVKKSIIEHYGISEGNITVIHNGVNE